MAVRKCIFVKKNMELKTLATATYQDQQLIGYLIVKKSKIYIVGTLSNGTHGIFYGSKLKNISKLKINNKPQIKLSKELAAEDSPESNSLKELITNVNKK